MNRPTGRAGDLFTGPSALWLRFLLMAVMVLATTADLADVLIDSIPNNMPFPPVDTHCWYVLLDAGGSGPQPLPPPSDPTYAQKYITLFVDNQQCFVAPNPLPISPRLAGAGLVVALCAALYLLTPSWRVFRSGLISVRTLPGIGPELDGLAAVARVRVRFVADVLNLNVGGLAFGRVGRRYVVLNRGLLQLAATDRAAFRAIVLHELAHVRNRDLDVAYLTVVLWRVFLAVVLLPTLILFHGALDADFVSGLGQLELWTQLSALALVVLVLHHTILRERELRADVRAAGWSDDESALLRVLGGPGGGGGAPAELSGASQRAVRRVIPLLFQRLFQWVFQLHPSREERRRAVGGAETPTGTGMIGQGFALGLALGLTWVSVLMDLDAPLKAIHLIPPDLHAPRFVVPGLIVITAPMGYVLCLAVWRAVLAGRDADRRLRINRLRTNRLRMNRLAAAVGAGLLIGDVVNGQDSVLGPDFFPLSMTEHATWWALSVAGTWVCVWWFAVAAWAWRPVAARVRPAWPALVGSLLGAALFGGWLAWAFSLRLDEALVGAHDSPAAFVRYALHSGAGQASAWPGTPLVVTVLALAVTFPVVGVSLRRWGAGPSAR